MIVIPVRAKAQYADSNFRNSLRSIPIIARSRGGNSRHNREVNKRPTFENDRPAQSAMLFHRRFCQVNSDPFSVNTLRRSFWKIGCTRIEDIANQCVWFGSGINPRNGNQVEVSAHCAVNCESITVSSGDRCKAWIKAAIRRGVVGFFHDRRFYQPIRESQQNSVELLSNS